MRGEATVVGARVAAITGARLELVVVPMPDLTDALGCAAAHWPALEAAASALVGAQGYNLCLGLPTRVSGESEGQCVRGRERRGDGWREKEGRALTDPLGEEGANVRAPL